MPTGWTTQSVYLDSLQVTPHAPGLVAFTICDIGGCLTEYVDLDGLKTLTRFLNNYLENSNGKDSNS
jgi:hypothetical protein